MNTAQQRLWVPPPPSTNNLFENSITGGRRLTQEYQRWRTEAGWELKAQRPRAVAGPVTLDFFHGVRSPLADCSNFVKAFEDLLVELCVIEGDSAEIVKRVSSGWVPDFYGSVVHITPLIATEGGGARWWVGFDADVLGNTQATVPSGRRQGQKTGEGVSEVTLRRRKAAAAGRPHPSMLKAKARKKSE